MGSLWSTLYGLFKTTMRTLSLKLLGNYENPIAKAIREIAPAKNANSFILNHGYGSGYGSYMSRRLHPCVGLVLALRLRLMLNGPLYDLYMDPYVNPYVCACVCVRLQCALRSHLWLKLVHCAA